MTKVGHEFSTSVEKHWSRPSHETWSSGPRPVRRRDAVRSHAPSIKEVSLGAWPLPASALWCWSRKRQKQSQKTNTLRRGTPQKKTTRHTHTHPPTHSLISAIVTGLFLLAMAMPENIKAARVCINLLHGALCAGAARLLSDTHV